MRDKSDFVAQEAKSSSKDKEEHIRICLEKQVESFQTTGFENFYLINNPLPEINFEDVDTSCVFLGKQISAPLIISPMTGGCDLAMNINRNLAMAAQKLGVVMSVGSQRLGLENPSLITSYQVREVAPDIPLLANLGAVYLNYGYGLEECERAVDMIGADALILYLNPMQKVFQGGDNLNFEGVVEKIGYICKHLSVPVIIKEVGFGLSADASTLLKEVGVRILDVAGAGGTSWVKITRYLKGDFSGESNINFDNWGIPTADALISCRQVVKDIPIIASGGIRSGLHMAKAIALGASYVGTALPLLVPAMESGEAVTKKIENLIQELKAAMFCCGTINIAQLLMWAIHKKVQVLNEEQAESVS
ncbi:MAG: type 2 isopentenyl-diphosphate Delta-isomerase [Deltaproteobacteria bacterium]|nr:type 2 isopentenyl-diphosphate Delta-isomerase [Deltaproteobacteria bacterium]